jgi:outer membrane protein
MKKNAGIIFNIALLAAVAVLYFLHFSGKKHAGTNTVTERRVLDTSTNGNTFRIAYFDIDSITNNYLYCIDVKNSLDKLREETEKRINEKQRDFDLSYGRLQEKAAQAKLSDVELNREKEVLAEKQQAINDEREKGTSGFEQKRKLFETEIKSHILTFINTYNTPQKFTFILADEPGIFYYRDSLYNITGDVLDGLNRQYRKKR